MKIFLLSILAIGSVHSHTIGHAYRSGYWTYNPASGEIPQQTPVVQSYLRYYDNTGNERLVGYSYPKPVYGQQQISYVAGVSSPVYKTSNQDEFDKACEAHFRIWSLQQYQALKCEIDAIRAQGKEPSADMLLKFQPLEKIAFTTDFSTIAELPEIKRLREEHLRMWNEAHGQKAKQQYVQTVTDIQKAREDQLRLISDATLRVQAAEEQYRQIEQQKQQQPIVDTPEVTKAREDHLRLVNEAKLRIEQAQQHELKHTPQQFTETMSEKELRSELQQYADHLKAREEHSRLVNEATLKIKAAEEQLKQLGAQQITQYRQQQQQQQQQVVDTPEVMRAREEHLRLVNEANLRAQNVEQQELKYKQENKQESHQVPLLKAQVQQQHEQHIHQPLAQQQQQFLYHYEHAQDLKSQSPQQHQQQQLDKFKEEERLKEEKRILEFENLKQTQQLQEEYKQVELEAMREAERLAEEERKMKEELQHQKMVEQQNLSLEGMREAKRLAEEHQKINDELHQLKMEEKQRLEEDRQVEAKHLREEQEDLQKHLRAEFQNQEDYEKYLKNEQDEFQKRVNLQKEEYKQNNFQKPERAIISSQFQQQPILYQQQQVYHYEPSASRQETPEVAKAREEHLRIVSEIKSKNDYDKTKTAETQSYGIISKPLTNDEQLDKIIEEERLKDEKRFLELERLREAQHLQDEHNKLEWEARREAEILAEEERRMREELQRLKQKEHQHLNFEGMREAKRLAEEQQKINDELHQLQMEEKQRLEEDRQVEAKYLREEQEDLQKHLRAEFQNQQDYEKYLQNEQNEFQKRLNLQKEEYKQNEFKHTIALIQPGTTYLPATKTIQQPQNPQSFTQYQQYYDHNPFLKANPIYKGNVPQQQQQIFTTNPFLKTSSINTPAYAFATSNTVIPVVRYVQSAQQFTAGSQSPNTAEALQALEKATNEHYRAHELALERLRLAKLQNPNFKDCN